MTPANRRPVHTRSIRIDAYVRDDHVWELVANIRDVKYKDIELDAGTLRAGDALHDMVITVELDRRLQILAVQAKTSAAPFPGDCDTFSEVYQALVGLNLLQGFRAAVRERVGGNAGCTHINELATLLPTAAIQAFSHDMDRPDLASGGMPAHLDRCRALRLDGPVVAKHYPRWHKIANEGDGS
jgi:hypothetical protein